MDRWLRLIISFVRSSRPKIDSSITDDFRFAMQVWPTDVDISVVNNSAYLLYFECARIQMLVATGLLALCRKRNLAPIIRSCAIQYIKPLRRGDAFEIRSRVVGCTHSYFYVKHELVRSGTICTTSLAKVGFVGTQGLRDIPSLLHEIGQTGDFETKHDVVQKWADFEEAFRQEGIA